MPCRPDEADQTYSTAHLAQAQGKFCSMRHLAEPLHVDVSGRWVCALDVLLVCCFCVYAFVPRR